MTKMMRRRRSIVALLLLLTGLPSPVRFGPGAEEPAPAPVPRAEEGQVDGKAAAPLRREQERWQALPPEKRRELLAIHRRLEALPAAERQRLLERLRAMKPEERREFLQRAKKALSAPDGLEGDARRLREEILREKLRRLTPAERERLRSLPPPEQRRFFEERNAQRRQAIISRLPEAKRLEVAKLAPREQVKFLRRFQAEQAIQRTFMDPLEMARLRELPPAERRALLRPGPPGRLPPRKPDFLSGESWERWLELKPYERLRVLRFLEEPPPSGE